MKPLDDVFAQNQAKDHERLNYTPQNDGEKGRGKREQGEGEGKDVGKGKQKSKNENSQAWDSGKAQPDAKGGKSSKGSKTRLVMTPSEAKPGAKLKKTRKVMTERKGNRKRPFLNSHNVSPSNACAIYTPITNTTEGHCAQEAATTRTLTSR